MNAALNAWMGAEETPKPAEKPANLAAPKSARGTPFSIFRGGGSASEKKKEESDDDGEDPARVAAMRSIERKVSTIRDKKAIEIYLSEVAYVRSLHHLVDACLKQARACGVEEEDIRGVFCNAEVIYQLNLKFLDDLQKRLEGWRGGGEEEVVIGDVILQMIPFFKMYEDYYKNYQTVPDKLHKMEKSKRGKTFLHSKVVTDKTHGHGLPHLLIQPCQRLVRYVLLLAELLKETGRDHKDFKDLSECLEKIQGSVSHMNESVRAAENQRIIANILKHPKEFIGFDEIIQPHRKLICDCAIASSAGDASYCHIYVFSDIAVFCTPEAGSKSKIRVQLKVTLDHLWYDPFMSELGESDKFQLYMPNLAILAQAPSASAKDDFLVTLDGVLRNVTESMRSPNGLRLLKYQWDNGDTYDGEGRHIFPLPLFFPFSGILIFPY